VIKPGQFVSVEDREPAAFGFGNTGPGQNDTVERVPTSRNYRPTRTVDYRNLGWIIELRIKHGQITPPAVPRRPVRPTYSGLNRQLLRCFPIVLDEQIGCCRHPWSHRLRARFRVIAEKTEKGIADPQSAAAGAIVKEAKSPVLVIRDRRRSGCQLNQVILARALDEHTPLDRVVADNLGDVIRPCIHEAGPGPRIGSGIKRANPIDTDGWKLFRKPFGAGEDERIIYPVSTAAARRSAREIVEDCAFAIRVRGKGKLVDKRGRNGADQTEGTCGVWTRPEFLHMRQPNSGGVEIPGNVRRAKRNPMFVTDQKIDFQSVLAQVGPAVFCTHPIVGALLKTWCRFRVRPQQGLTVGADAGLRNDVTRETGRLISGIALLRRWLARVPDETRTAKKFVRRVEQLTEISLAHGQGGNRCDLRLLFSASDPLLGHEEKKLAPVGVELPRNENRAADVIAVLVKTEGPWVRSNRGYRAVIACPTIRVQPRVAEVFNQIAMKVLCSAFRDEANLPRRRSPVFR